MRRTFLYFALLSTLIPLRQGLAWTLEIHTPPFAEVRSPLARIESKPPKGRHRVVFPDATKQAELEVRGPMGGIVSRQVSVAQAGQTLRFQEGILTDGDPNPVTIPHLPTLCPRLQAQPGGSSPSYLYRGEADALNRLPMAQLGDPDKWEKGQAETIRLMDGRNVLLLKSVRVRYDYEDDAITHQVGVDSQGQPIVVQEGRGGFYANFHYAVFPFAAEVLSLPEQTLLHLAQGGLQRIGMAALRPSMRTHGFLPGPFLSGSTFGYELCEWGDTAYHAPEQVLNYRGMALWDWDYPVQPSDRVLMVVWEGDEEDKARAQGQPIPPNYLLDDLVGVFEISRAASLSPLTLKNSRGDFEITVQTGDLPPLPAPPAPALPLALNP